MAGSNYKPAILCLHGGGTSAMIFQIQTIRLAHALPQFEFVFLDGPFKTTPGPGVLPVFESCGPFYAWIEKGQSPGHLPHATINSIKRAMESQLTKTGSPFIGVLGFSQGGKTAAGLLEAQQRGDEPFNRAEASFKFGVILMGTSPPLKVSPATGEEREYEPIKIPTVHVIGLEDPFRDESRKLSGAEYFDQPHIKILELELGHHLPPAKHPGTSDISREIIRMYQSAG